MIATRTIGVQIWHPTFVTLSALVVLRLASSPTATASILLLAAYALLGRRQAVLALLMGWFFLMLNPGIAPSPAAAPVLRYVILFCAAFSVFIRSSLISGRFMLNRLTFFTFTLGFFIVFHSIIVSPEPIVSILKAISWMLAVSTSLAAWSGMTASERMQTESQIFVILIAIAASSVLFLAAPFGYMRGTNFFRGVLSHSQALGPTLALLAAWIICLYLQRPRWIYLALTSLIIFLIFMSGARTALLAVFLGVAATSIVTPIIKRGSFRKHLPGIRSGRFVLAMLFGFIITLIFLEPIMNQLDDFLNKGREFGDVSEAYLDSRGGLIDMMMLNIRASPFTGIGFGIASDPEIMDIEYVAGIPVSAVVEKGVLPVAVLEELGIFGALLVATWLWSLIARSARSGVVRLGVLWTILASNMGEATLFSPGGMGMLSIVLLGWVVSANQRGDWGKGAM